MDNNIIYGLNADKIKGVENLKINDEVIVKLIGKVYKIGKEKIFTENDNIDTKPKEITTFALELTRGKIINEIDKIKEAENIKELDKAIEKEEK